MQKQESHVLKPVMVVLAHLFLNIFTISHFFADVENQTLLQPQSILSIVLCHQTEGLDTVTK
jgi:hypothetical protein